jgi:hypothetical protein
VGCYLLQGLLTEHAPFPVISTAPVAEFPARLEDRRLLDLVVAVVAAEFHGSTHEGKFDGAAYGLKVCVAVAAGTRHHEKKAPGLGKSEAGLETNCGKGLRLKKALRTRRKCITRS